MRQFLLLAVLILSAIKTDGAESDRPIDEQAEQVAALMGGWIATRRPNNIAGMTDAERQILIKYYRGRIDKVVTGGPDYPYRLNLPQYRNEMLKLGDSDTVAATVKEILDLDIETSQFGESYSDLIAAAPPERRPSPRPANIRGRAFLGQVSWRYGCGVPKVLRPAIGNSCHH